VKSRYDSATQTRETVIKSEDLAFLNKRGHQKLKQDTCKENRKSVKNEIWQFFFVFEHVALVDHFRSRNKSSSEVQHVKRTGADSDLCLPFLFRVNCYSVR